MAVSTQSQAASTLRAYTDAKVWATPGGQEVDGGGTQVLTATAAGQDLAGGNFSAAATASMGLLRADSGITVTHAPTGGAYGDAHADAEAYFTDTWTFTGKPKGTAGTLQLTVSVDGTTTADVLAGSLANVFGRFDVSLLAETAHGNIIDNQQYSTGNVTSVDTTQTITLHFQYGYPIDVSADIIAYDKIVPTNNALYIDGTATSSFSHTGKFAGLTVDGDSDYTLVTDSGAAYPFQTIAVPEPATLGVAGIAGSMLLLRRHRRGK